MNLGFSGPVKERGDVEVKAREEQAREDDWLHLLRQVNGPCGVVGGIVEDGNSLKCSSLASSSSLAVRCR